MILLSTMLIKQEGDLPYRWLQGNIQLFRDIRAKHKW